MSSKRVDRKETVTAAVKGSDVKRALLKKGFVMVKKSKHEGYVIKNPETGKEVWTVFSRGNKGEDTLSAKNVSYMAKELKFESPKEFKKYVSCRISEDEYRAYLKSVKAFNKKSRSSGNRIRKRFSRVIR